MTRWTYTYAQSPLDSAPEYRVYDVVMITLALGRRIAERHFRWRDDDQINSSISGVQSDNRFQPKAALVYTPSLRMPRVFSFNYGRGINAQDARGIVERPDAPRSGTTDFYQLGAAYENHPRNHAGSYQ
jgi:hypothetical protein